jgi:Domain of unknown function (DUF4405)
MDSKPNTNRNTTNLIVDSAIFLVFLIGTAPHFTGLAIHEWLGLAFGAAIIVHLLLHWRWIVAITRRIVSALPATTRLNYVLNSLLFIAVTVLTFTGVMISDVALPMVGITMAENRTWTRLHHQASNALLLLVGLHVALHWQWIVQLLRRVTGRRVQPQFASALPTQPGRNAPASQVPATSQEVQR